MWKEKMYKTNAEKQKAYRDRRREEKIEERKKGTWSDIDEKLKESGYDNLRQFMEASEEDIRNFALGETVRGKDELGGRPPEMTGLEISYRRAIGLTQAYREVKTLKREAKSMKIVRATFLTLIHGNKSQFWLVMASPRGEVKWKQIGEEITVKDPAEDIPMSVRAMWVGAKGVDIRESTDTKEKERAENEG